MSTQILTEEVKENNSVATENSRMTEYEHCPSCGAVMVYDPLTTSLKCSYCGTYKPLQTDKKARNYEYNDDTELLFENWGGIKTYKCSACGAICDLPDYEMSPVCPFCGTGNMLLENEIKGLRPNGILPFKIDEGGAKLKYKEFIKKKLFAPRKLRKNFNVNKMNGIYIPVFSFTTDTFSSYSGSLGEHYYVTVGSGKNRHTEQRTRYYNVSGNFDKAFYDLQYEVSNNITQRDLEKTGGFDVSNALEYDSAFFAGFSSERYTESLDNTWDSAVEEMKGDIYNDIVNSYHADVVEYLNINTDYKNRRYRYILAPIWKCGYRYKEKLYNFIINARNGKTAGKAPVSPLKVSFVAIAAIAITFLILFLLGVFNS